MKIDELVDYLNTETKYYFETVIRDNQVSDYDYFSVARFTDEALYNLHFACDIMFETPLGAPNIERLDDNNMTLQMFEPLQAEFRKRLGYPDPYGAGSLMKI